MNKRLMLLATTTICGLGALGFPAFAQEVDDQATEVEEIVVTGSRIAQPNLTSTSPITQVTAEDIDITGVTRVEDLITQLPQAFAAQNSTVSNGASGTATVSLRNLGSSRTLVLIDGRRMGYGSPNDDAADLNQIPEQLVERVEVLTGGASAVYGSDAVAGVVNFLMKKDFEGIQLDAQYGFYQHNNDYDGVGNVRAEIQRRSQVNPSQFQLPDDNVIDGESTSINLIMGVSDAEGRGNITAYAGYRNNNPILQANRDYSACTIGAPNAASGPNTYSCGGSGTSFPGRFTDFSTFDYTIDQSTGDFVNYNGDVNAYNFGPLNYYQRPDERYTLGAFGYYELNDRAELYTQLMFSDYKSVAQIAPSGNFNNTLEINCDNPLLSSQQADAIGCDANEIANGDYTALAIGRRNVEGGGRQDSLNYESYRGVVGVRGDLSDTWSYDVTAQYSRVNLSRVYNNDFSISRLERALDVVDDNGTPTCRSVVDGSDPDCVPYDIFSVGGVTQEALDYLQVPLIQTGETTQQVITGVVTGDTGLGLSTANRNIQVAIGGEYRRDYLGSVTVESFASGDGAGQGGATIGFSGDTEVIDGFAEVQVPLIDDRPWAYSASFDAAYRHSEYAGGVTTDTFKAGLDYAPVEDVRFRGSYSRAVRAPNVIELFTAQGFNLFDADYDPCDAANRPSTAGAVPAACIGSQPWQVTAAQSTSGSLSSPAGQYNFLQGGNPDLNPEKADTYTFGVVFQPSFVPGFNLSIDYYSIKIEDLISTLGSLNTLNLCYEEGDADACSRIVRNSNGQLWVGDGYVEDLNINIGGTETSGVDVNASYGFDLERVGWASGGAVRLAFAGSYLEKLEIDTGAQTASSVYDCAGFYGNQCSTGNGIPTTPNPKWRHRASATWTTPWDVDLTATWRHIGEVEIAVLGADGSLNNGGTRLDRYFDAYDYIDLAGVWQAKDNVRFRAGVNNVFDIDPPLSYSVGTTGNGNTYPQTYDARGRYFFFGVTADF